ncbi:MAG TPA: sulfatase-like hydrolase/transferase, partial [Acidobacteriota bacterium]|nr:sulfatase-like hydrolase/transferase [Acidobacteriota bacterium]
MNSSISWKIALFVCLALSGCNSHKTKQVAVDLIKRLPYAERIDNSQVIFFGRAEAKPFLLTGWSEAEREGKETYQWASAPKTSFFFKADRSEPLYLHIKLGSFFSNSANVFLNKRNAGKIQVNGEADVITIPLPAEALQRDANIVEFDWNELRSPEHQTINGTSAAAAAYYAVITPAKYLSGTPQRDAKHQEESHSSEFLNIGTKKRSALVLPAGGIIRYYEKLNKNSRLKFGVYYHPPAIPQNEDYATFTVSLRKDGVADKHIFEKKAEDGIVSFEDIPLSKYISSNDPSVYQIELRLKRNSIFDSAKAAWIEPVLYQDAEEPLQVGREALDQFRMPNRNANVIIMLLDAAGARHFQAYGYKRDTAPNFDALVRDGVLFNRAYTQAVYTLASTASLMTGLDPYTHQVIYRKSKLPSATITLAERFQSGGYDTGTFVANGNASGIFGMTQGFNEIGEVFRAHNYTGWGSDVTNAFLKWLEKSRKG